MNPFSNEDIRNYADFLNNLSPNELMILSSIIGILMSQGLTATQANSIGNFLEAVGQLILTYGAQTSLINNQKKY